jgi:hypothetical protein
VNFSKKLPLQMMKPPRPPRGGTKMKLKTPLKRRIPPTVLLLLQARNEKNINRKGNKEKMILNLLIPPNPWKFHNPKL